MLQIDTGSFTRTPNHGRGLNLHSNHWKPLLPPDRMKENKKNCTLSGIQMHVRSKKTYQDHLPSGCDLSSPTFISWLFPQSLLTFLPFSGSLPLHITSPNLSSFLFSFNSVQHGDIFALPLPLLVYTSKSPALLAMSFFWICKSSTLQCVCSLSDPYCRHARNNDPWMETLNCSANKMDLWVCRHALYVALDTFIFL